MGIKLWPFKSNRSQKQNGSVTGKRSYAAAATGRLLGDFRGSNNTADGNLRYTLRVLRNRSRELVRDSEYARRYINVLKTNVVGSEGFHVQVKAKNDDKKLDKSGNQIIENSFKRWGRLGGPTVDGRMSWLDCQRMVIETLARDGEVFIHKVVSAEYRDGFALQFIEADLIDEDKNEKLRNGNQIRMGIELNQAHKPVAYHVLTSHPGDHFYHAAQATKHVRVPAEQMIHIYMPNRTHQTRGEPFMVAAMSALKHLDAYREAEVIAARISASTMGFFTSNRGDETPVDRDENGAHPEIDFEPATFQTLPEGLGFQAFDPKNPNSNYGEFQSDMLKGAASGLNISYASLSGDLSSANYSSIRQGALDERDGFRVLQKFLIEHFLEPVFREWLKYAMQFGDMPLPITKFDKFSDNVVFRGRGWNWIDPLKEMQASVVGLQNGVLSMQDVAAVYGRDAEETMEQISRDKEVAESLGLNYIHEPFGGGLSSYGPAKIGLPESQETEESQDDDDV